MTSREPKKQISTYILPILFCGLLIALALIRSKTPEPASAWTIQEGKPLTLTDMAIENFLYTDGFMLDGERVLDAQGQECAALTVTKGEEGEITAMTLTFPLPAFIETELSESLGSLKADRDEAARRGEDMFLALFDAIAATDGRVAARRDSALAKLRATMTTGKVSAQSANSWRFSFSLEPGQIEETATILFTLVK